MRWGKIISWFFLGFCKVSLQLTSTPSRASGVGLLEAKVGDHLIPGPERISGAFHGPSQGRAQGLSEDRSTGFADGRQLLVRPFIHMALPQFFHQETVG